MTINQLKELINSIPAELDSKLLHCIELKDYHDGLVLDSTLIKDHVCLLGETGDGYNYLVKIKP